MTADVDRPRGRRRGWVRDGWAGLIARLSIGGRLLLLVVLPLGSAVLAAGPFVAVQVFDAAAAGRTAEAAADTRAVAALMGELQSERLLLSAFLASPEDDGTAARRQQGTVDETVERVRAELGSDLSDELAAALVRVGSVREVRDIAAVRGVSPDRVARSYHATIEALVDALRLVSRQDSDDARGARQLTALDALLRADEFAELRDAALVAVAVDPGSGLPLLENSRDQSALFVERFVQQADTELAGLVVGVTEGKSAQNAAALATRLPDPLDPAAVQGFAVGAVEVVGELAAARQGAREQVTALIAGSALDRASAASITAWVVGLGTALLILLVAALSVLVSRSIAIPLRRLTEGARDVTGLVADLAERELTDVSDGDQRVEALVPQPPPIEVASDDELGRLTAAFNQMRATAVGLIERQIITRKNVSLMFANVARRTQNLASSQLALVDELERNEQDSRMLASLYRLDHLSTRLRRNADNLLVVAGARDEIGVGGPTDLSTALRAALAQIEDYKRVRISDPPDLRLAAGLGADLVLLFAELLENATSFSPPHAGVEVEVRPGGGSYDVVIVDHGMGMPADRLAEENSRLVDRERLDIVPTTVLGLFVVGRISRRHGLVVQLAPTPGYGGVTVRVTVPGRLFVRPAPAVAAPARTRHPEMGATAIPAVVIPSAVDNISFTWFADDPAMAGRPSSGAGAGGFGPRVSGPPNGVVSGPPHGVVNGPPHGVVNGPPHGVVNGPPQGVPGGTVFETRTERVATGPRSDTETRGGLRRRVVGDQLPDAGRAVARPPDLVPAQRRPLHDPASARTELGEFEAGFSRAAAAPTVQRSGLTRRVPGMNMAPELRSGSDRPHAAAEQARRSLRHPEEERDRFDAFQDAVARSARYDPTEETTA